MLYAGSDDGVYRFANVDSASETSAEQVLATDDVYRIKQFDNLPGLFAASESGLYHSPDGTEWTRLAVPEEHVYAVTASPAGDRLYAGTRPSHVYVADWDGVPTDNDEWEPLAGFEALRERTDWGIPRHDGRSQVRSLNTHPDAPERVVVGVEVGGIHVSDDSGETWQDRYIEGFDAPHTDDIHHIAFPDPETLVAATGSGLFHSADAGRSWTRLDTGHRQRYFRGSLVHNGTVYTGAAPASSASWEDDRDHALFVAAAGEELDRVESPTPEEVPLGWTTIDGDPVTATHLGSLLRETDGEWHTVGAVPTPGAVRGRYMPLCWAET
jgi:hypothetical protein